MVYMEPVIAPLMSNIRFRLSNLVGVVGEDIINSSAVDVKILAEIFH